MEPTEQLWGLARRSAERFLRRYDDPLTRRERDDLVQECAVSAWRWAGGAREPHRFVAAVLTIAKRMRYRMMDRERRRNLQLRHALQQREAAEPTFVVRGRVIPGEFLREPLQDAAAQLSPLDRQLLMSSAEGFCTAELAERYGLREHNVKARLHRARRRLRRRIEATVCAHGDFELHPETPVQTRRQR